MMRSLPQRLLLGAACAAAITVAAELLPTTARPGGRPPVEPLAPHPSRPRVAAPPPAPATIRARLVVRTQVLALIDHRRTVRNLDGIRRTRRLTTVVRYPEVAPVPGSTRARRGRRYPLIVFGHGFGLTPRDYRRLLHAWAQAGYVVAAPAFPGERADAPGGPNRADLLNEPADLRFVINRLLVAARTERGAVGRAIDPDRVVVAGHSDGGNAALAVAYDPRYRSRRIDAAIILAGADLPGIPAFRFDEQVPPLFAVQGEADEVNPPSDTAAFYDRAHRPKLLLTLTGAGHLAPYMRQQPQLTLLARTTVAFIRVTLGQPGASYEAVRRIGTRTGVAITR